MSDYTASNNNIVLLTFFNRYDKHWDCIMSIKRLSVCTHINVQRVKSIPSVKWFQENSFMGIGLIDYCTYWSLNSKWQITVRLGITWVLWIIGLWIIWVRIQKNWYRVTRRMLKIGMGVRARWGGEEEGENSPLFFLKTQDSGRISAKIRAIPVGTCFK